MKHKYFILLIFYILSVPFILFSQESRKTILFNEGWKFHKGEIANGQSAELTDETWRAVDLPHDWSIEGPFSEQWASGTGYLPGGIGWYRKTFTLTPDLLTKNVFIYFDGVYQNSEVWINGHYLGKRPNGYIPFRYEVTPFLNKKGKNLIAVKADHTKFADSRWYTGSGIYRDVYLIAKPPVHIDLWGVAFTTSELTARNAASKITVTINNTTKSDAAIIVKSELRDKQGKLVAQSQKQVSAGKGKKSTAELSFRVESPLLWSVEQPNLYTLTVSLISNGKQTDTYREKVGFRNIRYDESEGFFLNGKNMKMKGVCIHHDAGALGAAVPEEVWERRLRKLKDLGCNAIRMSHYPHQDYLYELCDEMGFLVMDEAFDEWEMGKNKWIEGWNVGIPGKDGYHEYFKEWGERDLKDMVLRNRNRPSIVMWSIGNEIDYPNDPYTHEVLNTGRNPQIYGKGYQPGNPPASRLGEIAKRLVEVVKEADSSRPVTAALAGVVMSNFTSYPDALDLVGYNYQEYRYPEDHQKYPSRIIYGSENGKSKDAWLAVDTNQFIFGQFLWTGFDFMGEARKWPVRSSGAGLMDLAAFPKTDYYLRQSLWLDKPMVHLTVSRVATSNQDRRPSRPSWNWAKGDTVRVRCITNSDEAELFLNGRSLGRKSMKGDASYWELVYEPGELSVKGFKDGKQQVANKLKTTGEINQLNLVSDKQSFDSRKRDLAHIEIEFQDEAGNLVYEASNEVTVAIDGPARLLGLESGDLASHEDYKSNRRRAFNGKLLAYIQSEQKAGSVRITVSSPGLPSKTIEIKNK